MRFRHWDLYGERGLARQSVAVWLSTDVTTVMIAHAQEPLAQYTVIAESDQRRLDDVVPLRLYENRFCSLQPMLWEMGKVEWRLALRRPRPVRPPRRSSDERIQPPLLPQLAG